MIASSEVDDAKYLRLQCSDPVDYLLDVRNGPAFQCSGGQGGALLHGSRHFSRSTTIFIGSISAGTFGTLVAKHQ